MRSFCERQAEACTIGSQAMAVIGHRAQAGAKMIYDYLTVHFGEADGQASRTAASGNALRHTAVPGGRDTLLPADLVSPWRGPRSHKEARLDRS
jgi:hypothetical protein